MNNQSDNHDGKKAVLLTFQGGGAKGIVHVGALAAVEDLELDIKGIAGTSAGAMVAALVAAGYSSREMLNTSDKAHIIQTLGPALGFTKATDLFSRIGWLFIKSVRAVAPCVKATAVLLVALILLLVALVDLWRPWVGICLGLVFVFAACVIGYILLGGVSTVKRVRDFVDHAIGQKMGGERTSNVTFQELREAGGKPLKIVATNVTDKCVEVFSYERTPDVPIADAVAASICLPIVFRPWRFWCKRGAGVRADEAPREFLDGGITSNLPVWTLDGERAGADHLATIAFSIRPENPAGGGQQHWTWAMLSSIISGSMEIHIRAVESMVHVPIACSLEIFDFDAKLETLCEAVDKTREAVSDALEKQLTEFPKIFESCCSGLGEAVVDLLGEENASWFDSTISPAFMVALAIQPPNSWQLMTPYHFGYEPLGGPQVDREKLTEAWETLEPMYLDAGPTKEWPRGHYTVFVPVSKYDPGLAGDSGRKRERPLVVVIETDIQVKDDDQAGREFESFLDDLVESVVVFVNDRRIYEAVQRSTAIS